MIRLTFVSSYQRATPREYDTDDLGEAMAEAVATWFRSSKGHDGNGPIPWWFAVIVEQDGKELTTEEFAKQLADRASVERMHAAREPGG